MKRYLIVLFVLMLLLSVTMEVLFSTVLMQYRFPFSALIPAFFVFLGSVTVSVAWQAKGHGINVIMGVKVLKLILSLLLLFAYAFLVKEGVLPFALTFAAFFLIYLIYESWMFLDLNKNKDK